MSDSNKKLDDVKEKTQDFLTDLKEGAEGLVEKVKDSDLKDKAEDFVDDMSGAANIAVDKVKNLFKKK